MLKYKRNTLPPLLKAGLDFWPLLVLLLAYRFYGLMAATAGLIAATALSLLVIYAVERRVAPLPIAVAVLVAILGGLTLATHNEMFIKMKPTVIYLLFALALLVGHVRRVPMLKYVFDSTLQLTPEGWRALGARWGVFFIVLAAANELVWRNFPTGVWVNFKVLGMPVLTLLFTLLQVPLLKRTMTDEKP